MQSSIVGLTDTVIDRLGPYATKRVKGLPIGDLIEASINDIQVGEPGWLALPNGLQWVMIPELIEKARASKLWSEKDWKNFLLAIETAMLVEDHIPGYAAEYLKMFQVQGQENDDELFLSLTAYPSILKWIAQEGSHELQFWLYVLLSCDDPMKVIELRISEGRKIYTAPSPNPLVLFLYAALQEKATQVYYTVLKPYAPDPILAAVLDKIAKQEAQHCAFFTGLSVRSWQKMSVSDPLLEETRNMLENFSMPLSLMIEEYMKRAAAMRAATAGVYDAKVAYPYLQKKLQAVLDSNTRDRKTCLSELIATLEIGGPKRERKPHGRLLRHQF